MTDKLCMLCGHRKHWSGRIGDKSVCHTGTCPLNGVQLPDNIENSLQMRFAVLQKKLDKAIQGFSQIIEIYRRAYEPWKESCNDMYDVALDVIKEIEDIKG